MNYKTRKFCTLVSCGIVALNMMSCSSQSTDELTSSLIVESETNCINYENSESTQDTSFNQEINETTIEEVPTVVDPTCPFTYNENMIDLTQILYYNNTVGYCLDGFGFDNPYLREKIINYSYGVTGVYDENLTIDNFNFFRNLYYPFVIATPAEEINGTEQGNSMIVRIVMSNLGLRYCKFRFNCT